MVGNRSLRIILIAASAAVFAGVAAAQTKVAVINMQQAVLATAEIKKASLDLEAKYKPRQTQLLAIQKELEDLQQKLQAGQGKLTAQAESDLTAQAQRRQREYQRVGQDLQEEVDAERNDVLTRSNQKMQQVVAKLADKMGFDVIVDASSTVFFKPAMDITKDAVAAFDEAYPAK
jgi:outer membrane protein